MRFRILQKHNGEEYYYEIQQLNVIFWIRPESTMLRIPYKSCKQADDALSRYVLMVNTNYVVLERHV